MSGETLVECSPSTESMSRDDTFALDEFCPGESRAPGMDSIPSRVKSEARGAGGPSNGIPTIAKGSGEDLRPQVMHF